MFGRLRKYLFALAFVCINKYALDKCLLYRLLDLTQFTISFFNILIIELSLYQEQSVHVSRVSQANTMRDEK
jgi:hypothetical protein